MKKIILFDGECNFCQQSVQFIIKRDVHDCFRFASLQSKIGHHLLERYEIPHHLSSIILIDQAKWFSKSSAALRICKDLQGLWKGLFVLLIIPAPLRDVFYQLIAKNRYRLRQETDDCILPTPEVRKKFLSEQVKQGERIFPID